MTSGAAWPPAPRASVVVPARDAEATIGACLAALARQAVAPSDYEVIVVDDGSVDETAAIAARFRGVRVLLGRGMGADAARLAGARAARGEIVAFTDADRAPGEGWLEALLRPFVDPRVVAAGAARRFRARGALDAASSAVRRRALLASDGAGEGITVVVPEAAVERPGPLQGRLRLASLRDRRGRRGA